jgi:hypothetical protein
MFSSGPSAGTMGRALAQQTNVSTRPKARRRPERSTAGPSALTHMIQSVSEQSNGMRIQTIVNKAAVFARLDEPHLAQGPKMVGNGGLGQADRVGQGPDVPFAGSQHGQDPDAARVAEGAEQLRDVRRVMFVQDLGFRRAPGFILMSIHEQLFNY